MEYDGSKEYKAILLNYEDHTFVKNNIDQVSRDFFSNNLSKIEDVLSRTLIWRSFFEMVKDAQITSADLIQFVIKNIANEKSDSIFEKQFDLMHSAIHAYTPSKYRQELSNRVFVHILDLIQTTAADQANRLVILKNKLTNFASNDESKKILLKWWSEEFVPLKAHPMTVGQQWSAVVKAFTIKDMSIEEKEAIFSKQNEKDSSDTAKLKRHTCNSLKASKEEFI